MMKRRAMYPRRLARVTVLLAVLIGPTLSASAQPDKTFSFQGVLQDSLENPVADGSYDLIFRLHTTPVGNTEIWQESQTLAVSAGRFAAIFGKIAPLPDFVQPLWLGIAVGRDAEMVPRTEITGSPYTLGLATPLKAVGTGNVDALWIQKSSSTGGSAIFGSTDGLGAGVTGISAGSGAAMVGYNQGTGQGGWFEVDNPASTEEAIFARTNGLGAAVAAQNEGTAGEAGWFGLIDSTNGSDALNGQTPGAGAAVSGKASGSGVGVKGMSSGTGEAATFEIDNAASSNPAVRIKTNSKGAALSALSTAASLLFARYGIWGESRAKAGIGVHGLHAETTGSGIGVSGASTSNQGMGVYGLASATSGVTYGVFGENSSSSGYALHGLATNGGTALYALSQGSGPAAHVEVANASNALEALKVETSGTGYAGSFTITNTTTVKPAILAFNWGLGGAAELVTFHVNNPKPVLKITGFGGGPLVEGLKAGVKKMEVQDDGTIRLFRSGSPVITLDPDYAGDSRVITQELEITGGSDLAELFDIAPESEGEQVVPGLVVSIDPTKPGQLRVSSEPYDRLVAGVASGAGSIQTGLILRQEGSVVDGAFPIALVGRVYVLADATYGAIAPGDLLTTSGTPGHAMRVTDYSRSQGATIGKALTSLETGRGLVLTLISLQ